MYYFERSVYYWANSPRVYLECSKDALNVRVRGPLPTVQGIFERSAKVKYLVVWENHYFFILAS
jgi:hypothetical protein